MIGTSTVSSINTSYNLPWKNPQCQTVFNFTATEISAVCGDLNKLGSESSNDTLGFDAKLLALSAPIIAPVISKMFNYSLQYCLIPDDWKTARVTPLYKGKGSKSVKNNYRPIAVIGHIAKILERHVQRQLMSYLINHNYINIDQSAYRPGHSTQTSIIRIYDDCIDNMCDKLFTGLCFLDIKKCFDTIDHKILNQKLQYYGIINKELRWFQNYLLNRQQYVSMNGKTSSLQVINIGVPQGSVLGPVLFMLYINDLSQFVSLSTCNLYADDTVIYCGGEDATTVENKLQQSVNTVSQWYTSNHLCLNTEKCNFMIISPSRTNQTNCNVIIKLDDHDLDQVDTVDYLGIRFSHDLTWDAFINKLCSTLYCKLSRLSRLRKSAPQYILNRIYTSSIQPVIDYAICSWGFTYDYNINKVQRMQNLAARIVTGNFDYVNSRGVEILKSLGWMTVKQRRNYFTLLLMFKCLSGCAPDYLSNNFVMYNEVELTYELRSRDSRNVIVPYNDSAKQKFSFSYNCTILWNQLPDHYKSINELHIFKHAIKNYVSMYA